jgi:integrase
MRRMFYDDILPIIGNMSMEEVEPMMLLKVIRHFEERGAMEKADKARRRCGEVFRYAIIIGRAKYNPAPDLIDALTGYRRKNFPIPSNESHTQVPESVNWLWWKRNSKDCCTGPTLHRSANKRTKVDEVDRRRL